MGERILKTRMPTTLPPGFPAPPVPVHSLASAPGPPRVSERARASSILILLGTWLVLHFGCLFSPGLLDDVDSVYIEIAREMLVRHDYVTPYVDGIRFFDKPPLMYWLAAAGMKVFGVHDWAARLPLSLLVLAFFFAVYALGKRFFGERGGLYAGLAAATSIGPYLFTRFYIPDILNALWLTLGIHLFLIALDRVRAGSNARGPAWAFGAVLALNLLSKGLIGVVFPIAFVLLYAAITRELRSLWRMNPVSSTGVFLAIALPWHVLAAMRNPAIAMAAGNGLPARAGWAWFYLVNEHYLRFRGLRIPHDYGQVPLAIFLLLFFVWIMPWTAVLPTAARLARIEWDADLSSREPGLTILLWSAIVLGFFSFSARQEYYSLPAIPAIALLAAWVLQAADVRGNALARRELRRATEYFLLPLMLVIAVAAGVLAAISRTPPPHADIAAALTTNPSAYTLALGHLQDLTARAMGFFRGPLVLISISALVAGAGPWILRRRGREFAANLCLAGAMCGVLLAVHGGLARFYPILGSKQLGVDLRPVLQPQDALMIDGELTSGSSLLFYTRHSVLLVNGRINGTWFGSFWPDAPPIFSDDADLHRRWTGAQRVFLFTSHSERKADLAHFGPVRLFASAGGKLLLTNR